MPKYMIDNPFGFQPKVHQINSLRQKNALRFINGVLRLAAARHRDNRKNSATSGPCKFVARRY